jgi:hypothetical protein
MRLATLKFFGNMIRALAVFTNWGESVTAAEYSTTAAFEFRKQTILDTYRANSCVLCVNDGHLHPEGERY